jgi:YcaO-like protein with predicted kinase domain
VTQSTDLGAGLTKGLTDADVFVPTPKATTFGHALPFEDTFALVKPLLRRVPITRVANITPLDSLGFPVWSAVTPLAKDLTVHAGKGHNSSAARLSAIMESIERVCAERVEQSRILRASYTDLKATSTEYVTNPDEFDLPFEAEYNPDRVISWIYAYDLMERSHAWVTLDLVISPAQEGVCIGVETNGLAAGNTYTEATLHAIYELIERDACSEEQFCEMYLEAPSSSTNGPRMIERTTLPTVSQKWLDQLANRGYKTVVQDLTNDISVPVFGVFILDSCFPGAEDEVAFAGYGADLNPENAIFRALTEAVQSHTVVALGARDTFEGMRPLPDRSAMLMRQVNVRHPRDFVPFPNGKTNFSTDLLDDLKTVLGRLADAGLKRCLVVDLSRADLQIPVVRVLVPGLAAPYAATRRKPGLRLLRNIL